MLLSTISSKKSLVDSRDEWFLPSRLIPNIQNFTTESGLKGISGIYVLRIPRALSEARLDMQQYHTL